MKNTGKREAKRLARLFKDRQIIADLRKHFTGYDPKEDLRYVWSFELNIIGSNSFYDDDLQALMKLIAEGKMRPVIDKVLPLDQARDGLRLIQDREVIGKVVVTP